VKQAVAVLACLLIMLLLPRILLADVVELQSGERVEGTVRSVGQEGVVVVVGGQPLTFTREQVRAIYFGAAAAPPAATLYCPIVVRSEPPETSTFTLLVQNRGNGVALGITVQAILTNYGPYGGIATKPYNLTYIDRLGPGEQHRLTLARELYGESYMATASACTPPPAP